VAGRELLRVQMQKDILLRLADEKEMHELAVVGDDVGKVFIVAREGHVEMPVPGESRDNGGVLAEVKVVDGLGDKSTGREAKGNDGDGNQREADAATTGKGLPTSEAEESQSQND
jgi:hypothetical protein